jgi:C4-dicarboxylate-specific signal transduction histidine kinase
VNRQLTMGAMSASIAHEINQPLAAIVANGNAGLRGSGALHRTLRRREQSSNALLTTVTGRLPEVAGEVRGLVDRRSGARS